MPSAPPSRDLREGMEVVEVDGFVFEECVQLPSPREARMEERDLG